jgi:3,4-dihydroxy 2-butanone 4-phosphate synthase
MNILIPMGGKGMRFKNTGISMPKPLIDVDGELMINRVLDSIKTEGSFIYIFRKEHVDNYSIDKIVKNKKDGLVYILEEDNDGQTQTCLLAEESINNSEPLFIVNCDNYLDWDEDTFKKLQDNDQIDGAAFTFQDPKKRTHWCFAEADENNNITRLEEKKPISDISLAGGFYWKKGSDFVKYAKQMIQGDVRASNGEFYLGGVFNLAIQDNKTIFNYKINQMQSFGTPEELQEFNNWIKEKNNQMSIEGNASGISRNLQNALDELKEGKPIVLVDEHDRENEGDIVIAGEKANVDNLVFTMNKARGLMCIPCDGEILDKLEIPLMVKENTDKNETPFTVSVDASSEETTTGMSVQDRISTISVFTNPESKPSDLNRPGHLFPLRPQDGLLKDRRGHTEGSIELMKLAGLQPVSIICEIMNDDGTMAKGGEVNKFATENGLTLISIEELYEAVYGESL